MAVINDEMFSGLRETARRNNIGSVFPETAEAGAREAYPDAKPAREAAVGLSAYMEDLYKQMTFNGENYDEQA